MTATDFVSVFARRRFKLCFDACRWPAVRPTRGVFEQGTSMSREGLSAPRRGRRQGSSFWSFAMRLNCWFDILLFFGFFGGVFLIEAGAGEFCPAATDIAAGAVFCVLAFVDLSVPAGGCNPGLFPDDP